MFISREEFWKSYQHMAILKDTEYIRLRIQKEKNK